MFASPLLGKRFVLFLTLPSRSFVALPSELQSHGVDVTGGGVFPSMPTCIAQCKRESKCWRGFEPYLPSSLACSYTTGLHPTGHSIVLLTVRVGAGDVFPLSLPWCVLCSVCEGLTLVDRALSVHTRWLVSNLPATETFVPMLCHNLVAVNKVAVASGAVAFLSASWEWVFLSHLSPLCSVSGGC